MKEKVKARLISFGYTPSESDETLIDHCIETVSEYIKNQCNLNAVPQRLENTEADMICGEFLSIKKTFSPQSLDNLDLTPGIKQIQAGDTNTVFDVSGCQSDEQKLSLFIHHLRADGREAFSAYRRLRW